MIDYIYCKGKELDSSLMGDQASLLTIEGERALHCTIYQSQILCPFTERVIM